MVLRAASNFVAEPFGITALGGSADFKNPTHRAMEFLPCAFVSRPRANARSLPVACAVERSRAPRRRGRRGDLGPLARLPGPRALRPETHTATCPQTCVEPVCRLKARTHARASGAVISERSGVFFSCLEWSTTGNSVLGRMKCILVVAVKARGRAHQPMNGGLRNAKRPAPTLRGPLRFCIQGGVVVVRGPSWFP